MRLRILAAAAFLALCLVASAMPNRRAPVGAAQAGWSYPTVSWPPTVLAWAEAEADPAAPIMTKSVTVEVWIDRDGAVTTARVVFGPDDCRVATTRALNAAYQWVFTPAEHNGQPLDGFRMVRRFVVHIDPRNCQ